MFTNRQIIFLWMVCLSAIHLTAQAQTVGLHAPNIQWNNIDANNVNVIFPKGLDKQAFRIANLVEHIHANNTYSVGNKSKKLDLILQTNQVISNGFVTLGPYRSEFFGTGLQDFSFLGSNDWLDVLAIHEYRHALQMANANRGLTKASHLLQGQMGWGIMMNLSLPNWYFEGDATVSETLLTNTGRGRTPSFFKELRANLLNDQTYTYMTSRNGSFKRMLPSHYPLGYAICNYTRNHHGMDVWAKIVADAGRYKRIIYPFAGAMKRHTGKNPPQMYQEAYASLKQQWESELAGLSLTPTETILPIPKKTVTNYRFPQYLKDGSIVAHKISFNEIGHLVHIKDGKERFLTSYGVAPDTYLSVNNDQAVWVELEQDKRWANRNFTRIVTYDIQTNRKKYLTAKSKYFSPAISGDGTKIVSVRADEMIENRLVILEATSGEVIQVLPNAPNDFLAYPKWTKDNQSIVYLAKRGDKIAIIKYHLKEGTSQMLTDWTYHTIGVTYMGEAYIYFTGSFSGIDNIYAVSLNGDKEIKQLTSVKIGAYDAAISNDGQSLLMSEFTDMGSLLTKMELKNPIASMEKVDITAPANQTRWNIKTNPQEESIVDNVPETTYEVNKYKGLLKGLKLHSWSFDQADNNPKFNLMFDNVLSDLKVETGFLYNRNEETTNYFGKIKYGKFFTEIALDAQILNRSTDYLSSDTIATATFDETTYGAALALPLNWIKGNDALAMGLSVQYNYHKTSNHTNTPENKADFNLGTISTEFSFSKRRQKALQHIYPRFGQALSFKFQTSTGNISAKRLNMNGTVYLPGLFANHGIKIDAGWQRELSTNDYQFSDLFFYARGYENAPNDETYRLAINYAFPIGYPDWGFSGITYFKRIRANLFFDVGGVKLNDVSSNLNSYGAELLFDNTFLNLFPLSLGLRQSFLLNEDILNPDRKNRFEVFATVNL